MFLIIKVNVPIDLIILQDTSKKLQGRRIKKNYRGGYQLMKNAGHYGCLTKKYCNLKQSTVARNTFNIRRGR